MVQEDVTMDIQDLQNILPYSPGVRPREQGMENLIRWVLTPREIIDEIDHNLRGEVPGSKPGQWEQKGERLLNDVGIRKMISIIASRVNKIMIMSNFDDKMILDMMFFVAMDIRTDLFENFEYYDMEFHNLTTVSQMVKDLLFGSLRQALNGGARLTWSKIQRVNTFIQEDRTQKKSNWIPFSGGGAPPVEQ